MLLFLCSWGALHRVEVCKAAPVLTSSLRGVRGSAVKMVNQLLAGVHIAAAAEAMALGARADLDTRVVYDIISHAAGNSW